MSQIIELIHHTGAVRFTHDGWLHATEVAARFGREPARWLQSPETLSYLVALANALNIKSVDLQEFNEIIGLDSSKPATKARILRLSKQTGLVRTKSGAPCNGGGTWLHPKLAVTFARWLGVKFFVWCDQHSYKLLGGELGVVDRKKTKPSECAAELMKELLLGKNSYDSKARYRVEHRPDRRACLSDESERDAGQWVGNHPGGAPDPHARV